MDAHALADLELEPPAVWRACSTAAKQPGSVTANARAVDAQLAGALDDHPHAAGLVRAGVGARLVLGLRRDQRVRRVLGAHAARPARASTPSSSWISSSVST